MLVTSVRSASRPGFLRHTSTSPSSMRNQKRLSLISTSGNSNWRTAWSVGSSCRLNLRCIAHERASGSISAEGRSCCAQRWPHTPNALMIGRNSFPASVRRYCTRPECSLAYVRWRMPASCNSCRRWERVAGEIRGMPRRKSPKRQLPASNSRTTTGIQRSARSSAALATGQKWANLVLAMTERIPKWGRGSQYVFHTRLLLGCGESRPATAALRRTSRARMSEVKAKCVRQFKHSFRRRR